MGYLSPGGPCSLQGPSYLLQTIHNRYMYRKIIFFFFPFKFPFPIKHVTFSS